MVEQESSKNRKKIAIMQGMAWVIVFLIMLFVLRNFVFQRNTVEGSSMEGTLSNGDSILVEKVSYTFSKPKRFDVVVCYPFGRKQGDYFVKRVIGLPGETIQIKDGKIYINGSLLEENYGNGPIDYEGIAEQPYLIPEEEYFLMGDNRISDESYDSRYEDMGAIDKRLLAGKVFVRISPLSKFKFIKK